MGWVGCPFPRFHVTSFGPAGGPARVRCAGGPGRRGRLRRGAGVGCGSNDDLAGEGGWKSRCCGLSLVVGDHHHEITAISQDLREAAIRSLAGRQAGNISRAQLLGIGLSEGAVDARLRTGALTRRFPGVYALPSARQDAQSLIAAAVLAAGPGAAASHASAAYLWGWLPRWDPPPEVTLAAGDRRPRGVVTHRCRSLQRQDITYQRGIRTTSPARTVLDLAPRLGVRRRMRLVNDALRSRDLRPAALSDVLDRNRCHPGTKLLRPFDEDTANPTRSGFEDDFRAFADRYGLPTPLINTKVDGHEVDAFFPEHGLIVECDGWDFHNDRAAFEDDRERDAAHLEHDNATVRITEQRLTGTPDREAARLHRILSRRSR